MIWYTNLYVDSHLSDRASQIRTQIDRGDYPDGVWLITSPANGRDLLDIRPARGFGNALAYLPDADRMTIYGIAKNRKEAVLLVSQIAQDAAAASGTDSPDLRSFLMS